MPLELLSAYGAGVQIHVEDLADHLAGRERRDDAKARWDCAGMSLERDARWTQAIALAEGNVQDPPWISGRGWYSRTA
jgi:hypothetical protein